MADSMVAGSISVERFTDCLRKVMQLANQEANRFNHEYVGTEHLLLGLVKENSGIGCAVLKELDIDLGRIKLEAEKIIQKGSETVIMMEKLPQTPRARKVIEYAIKEAVNTKRNYVGTEHLLVGLILEQEGVAAQVLSILAVKIEDVREEIIALKEGYAEVKDDEDFLHEGSYTVINLISEHDEREVTIVYFEGDCPIFLIKKAIDDIFSNVDEAELIFYLGVNAGGMYLVKREDEEAVKSYIKSNKSSN